MEVPDVAAMARLAREHWQEHRPTLYAHLAQTGQLEVMIETAARQTLEAMERLISRGTTPLEAWQLMREEWLLVPEEERSDLSPEALSWPA
ncbi:MAG: hypothetical protein HS126_37030 [Anaerolineales bacterium]|nr:hypothetical protein [Anaerolineales bacterium]